MSTSGHGKIGAPFQGHDAMKFSNADLKNFLIDHLAVRLFSAAPKSQYRTKTILHFWSAGGRTFIIVEYGDDEGWDIFIPASTSNSTKETLQAAREYLERE
jgi:hypothetical protein